MTEQESARIDSLIKNPPRIELTTRQKMRRAVTATFYLIAAAAMVLSVVDAASGARLATCTNSNLGVRNAPNEADRSAQDAAIDALYAHAAGALSAAQLATAHASYVATRKADDAARAAHPIGHC